MIKNEDALDVREYLRIIKKHKWLITTCLIVVVFSTAFFTYRMKPIYQAIARLSIESESPNVVSFKDVVTLGQSDKDYYMTQCEIIKSRTIAERAYRDLGLWEKHKKAKSIKKTLEKRMINNKPGFPKDIIEKQIREGDFLGFMKGINVKSIRNTRLVEILAENKDPGESADIANTIAKVYQEENLKIKLDTTEDAGNWLLRQIKDQRRKLHETEVALQNYVEEHEIVYLPATDSEDENNSSTRLISNLKEKLALLEAEQVTLSSRYKEKHPKMVRFEAEIQAIREKIGEEIGKNSVLNKKSIKYNMLKREVEVNQRIYDSLLNRAKETNISVDLKSNNIRIIDPARIPEKPIKPKPLSNLLLAMILGLLGGTGLSFFLENMDDTIKNPDEIKHYTKLQVLGTIPLLKEGKDSIELISHTDPESIVSEAFKTIRTAVNFSLFEKPQKSILVTSPGPEEGKTSCVINLAISIAKTEQKVLLVDTDMRKPKIHNIFNLPNKNGLSRVLINELELNDAILQTTIPNLFVLPCGPVPHNPSELLGSARMKQIVEKLKYSFDIVLFDSPPVTAITDSVLLSSMVEGVILIIQYNKTKINHLINAKNKLDDSQCNIIGTVSNKLDIKDGGYYYPYYKYYYREEKLQDEVRV